MTATIEQSIQSNLAAIFRALPGITKAYEAAPMAIRFLPAVVVLPGQASPTGNVAPEWMEIRRRYSVLIYITHVQAGETGDAETNVMPWIAAAVLAILQHPGLGTSTVTNTQVPYVMSAAYAGDSGLAVLPAFNGEQFLGVSITVDITYKIPFKYAKFE